MVQRRQCRGRLFCAARLIRAVPLESHLPGLAIAISALVGCHLQARLSGAWDVSYAVMTLLALSSAVVVWRMTYLRLGLMRAWNEQAGSPVDHGDRLALTARLRWWVYVVVWILTIFALRFLEHAPQRPWPTAIFLVAAAALAGMAGWIEMRWRALWWSALLVNLAATIVWLFKGRRWQFVPNDPINDLLYVNVLAATLPTLGWVLIGRHWKTRPDAAGLPARAAAVHRYLVPIAVVLLVALATLWMQSALGGSTALPQPIPLVRNDPDRRFCLLVLLLGRRHPLAITRPVRHGALRSRRAAAVPEPSGRTAHLGRSVGVWRLWFGGVLSD